MKIEHRQATRIQETDHVISSQITSNETHALNQNISSLVMKKGYNVLKILRVLSNVIEY